MGVSPTAHRSVRVVAALLSVAALALTSAAAAGVSNAPLSSPAFDSGVVNDAYGVRAVAVSGSTAYVSGDFKFAGGTATGSFVQLDLTQGAQRGGWPQVDGGSVRASIPDGAGGRYIGGTFTSVDGQPRAGLAHIEATGALDTQWAPKVDGAVRALARSGPTIYVGGEFTHVNGVYNRTGAASFDATSGVVKSWNPKFNGDVYGLAIGPAGLYAVGDFNAAGSTARNGAAAVSLSTGAVSSWNPALDHGDTVYAVIVSGSNVYIGGTFYAVNNDTAGRLRVAEFNATTGNVTAWSPNINFNTPGNSPTYVEALAVSGNSVYVGGDFQQAGTATRNGVAAFDRTTGARLGWDPRLTWGTMPPAVTAIAVAGSTVYLGGAFDASRGKSRPYFAAVDATTGAPTTYAPKIDGEVDTIAPTSQSLFVGGTFDSMNGQSRPGLASFNLKTGALLSWKPQNPPTYPAVALAVSGSTLFAAGETSDRNGVVAYNTTTGAELPFTTDITGGSVDALLVDGSTLYVGGGFYEGSSSQREGVAAVDATTGQTTSWPAVQLTTHGLPEVYALALDGSTIFAAGNFDTVDSVSRSKIAAFDATNGAVDAWNAGTVTGFRLLSLAVANGRVYVGGAFSAINGTARQNLAALSASTGSLLSWDPEVTVDLQQGVDALVADTSTVYAGGSFSAVGTTKRQNLAAIDAATGKALSWNPAADGPVTALTAAPGYLLSGGGFTRVSATPRDSLAVWASTP